MKELLFLVLLLLSSLFITGIVTRVVTHAMHVPQEYNDHTFTGYLREKSGYEIHHFHFGVIIFFFSLVLVYYSGFDRISAVGLGVGTSLIVDQVFPYVAHIDYFGVLGVLLSAFLHVIIGIVILVLV